METSATPDRSRWLVRIFFACTFIVFTFVFPYNTAVNNPNENVRVYATMALVDDGTFRIDSQFDTFGWVNDMARIITAETDHYYSLKAPAVTYAAVPFYWAFSRIAPRFGHARPTAQSSDAEKNWWKRAATLIARVAVVQLPCFVFLVWFERWLRGVTSDVVLRLAAVTAVGLGSNFLAYSFMFASHSPTAASVFVSFALVTDELARPLRARRISRALLAGFFAGLATQLEYQAFVLSVGLAIYAVVVFRRVRPLAAFGAAALVNAAGLMIFQWRCFGGPFTPGYPFAENETFAEWHKQGLFGLGRPDWGVFRDLSVSQTFGFFTTCRFMTLAAVALPIVLIPASDAKPARHLRIATIVAFLLMLAHWLVMSGAVNWRGGWTVGPRFLGPAPPFFAFGIVLGFDLVARRGELQRALARAMVAGLAAAAVCTLGVVSLLYNSFPEEVERPLTQIVLPLALQGFVPHHLGELVGWNTPTLWYFVVALAVAVPVMVALWPAGDRPRMLALRVALSVVALVLSLRPQLQGWAPWHELPPIDQLASFAHGWEPADRDYVARARRRALEEGAKTPCLFHVLAMRERRLGWKEDADRDEVRTHRPAGECPDRIR